MITVFHPTGIVKGTVSLPSSKSISNRALIIRALTSKSFSIDDLSQSSDTLTLFKLLLEQSNEYDCGDGGTTFRFLLALKALKGETCVLTGSQRMQERPIKPLVDALNALGAEIDYMKTEGFPPVKINNSQLTVNNVTINASVSSQFISALMMIGPQLPEGLTINLKGSAVSSAYILLTKKLMEFFKAEVTLSNSQIIIPSGKYKNREIIVEKDWSAASYIFEAAALSKEADILLEGLEMESIQGDQVIAAIIKQFGINAGQEKNGVRIKKSSNKIPSTFEYNFIDHPDLVMTMAFLCAAKGVKGEFKGIQSLRIKETDRVAALKSVLNKFGVELTELNNTFSIKKTESTVNTIAPLPVFNDHRMAMAIAPLSLAFGKLTLEHPEVVKKSYPGYWDALKSLGFEISPN